MSIEGISLENFSATTHTETSLTPQARTCHAVFHSFLYDDSKQNSATTITRSKRIIELLKQHNIMLNALSKIWETQMVVLSNTDVPLHYTCCGVAGLFCYEYDFNFNNRLMK